MVARAEHAAILLPTGQVLIVGGTQTQGAGLAYPNQTELYDPETGTFSVMDKLDYGLSEPQVVLLKNGDIFLAGQVQPPMDPPTVAESKSQSLRMRVAAANITYQGSSVLGIINGVRVSNTMSFNQGVERLMNTLGTHNSADGNPPAMAWKDLLPGIANRKALVSAKCKSTMSITAAQFALLKGKMRVYDSNGIQIGGDINLPLVRKSDTEFRFEVTLTEAQTPEGGALKVELDSDNIIGRQTYNYDPKWTLSQSFVVKVCPITYILSSGIPVVVKDDPSTGSQADMQLTNYANALEKAMYEMYPISAGRLSMELHPELSVITWDERALPPGVTLGWPHFYAGKSMLEYTDSNGAHKAWEKLTNNGFMGRIQAWVGLGDTPPNQYFVGVMPNIPGRNYDDTDEATGLAGITTGKTKGLTPSVVSGNSVKQCHYSIVTYGVYSGGIISPAPPLYMTDVKNMEITLHELGHQHGTQHTGARGSVPVDPYCQVNGARTLVLGWNSSTPSVTYPVDTWDIMGYSPLVRGVPKPDQIPRWPSDHTFCIWYQHEIDVNKNYTSTDASGNAIFH